MSRDRTGPPRPTLRLVHHHPGRLRLRSEAFERGDAASLAERALLGSGAATRVVACPETGSLVVEYTPGRHSPDDLVRLAASSAGLSVDPCVPERPSQTHAERFVDACRRWNRAAYEETGFRVEPRTLLPVGVLAMAGVFFVVNRAQRMPRWDNLAYWSLSLFAMLHGPEIGRARADDRPPPPRDPDGRPR